MLKPADNYFLRQEEPIKGCLLALRKMISSFDPAIIESLKYGMPFYCYNGKMFCYLWVHKKFKQPYIGIVEGGKINHPLLIQEKRVRMKIMLVDPLKDIPVKTIDDILKRTLALYTR
ncbi:MAG TPA: DUF1801 domain-containing protein [Chitinophagaceae bacterium]|nr:DUF1801 domain-containing protein [Chitinophagaceae bacterium]